MTRVLLFFLFFILLAADTLGINLSLGPGLSVKNALLYLIFLGIAVDTALQRNRNFEVPSVIVPYGLCVAYAIFTWLVIVLIVDYSGYSAFGSLISLKGGLADHLIVLLVFFYGTLNVKDSLWLLKAMIWTVIVINFLSVVDALNVPDLGFLSEREDGRIGGPIGESNQYAVFVSLFFPSAIALAVVERGWRRHLAMAAAGVSAVALLLTVSRGGILGAVSGGILGAFFLRRYIPPRALVSSLVSLGVFGVVALLIAYAGGYGQILYDRLIGLSTGGAYTASSGRTVIWSTALAKMSEAPLTLITGYGWGTYRSFPDFGFAPHNSYLGIYFELGMVGLLLVMLAFANVLRIVKTNVPLARPDVKLLLMAYVFGLFSVLVGIFFVDLSASPWIFVWAFTGASLRLAVASGETERAETGALRLAGEVRRVRAA
jgi:O-antigen ligase